MSASYNKPGRPQDQGRYPDQGYDPYDDVVTAPATGTRTGHPADYDPRTYDPGAYGPYSEPAPPPRMEAEPRPEMYAPARKGGKIKAPLNAPIVPAGSVTGRSLNLVIAIMCFLACLTAGAVYMINQSADAWLRDIASEVTVQIEPKDETDTDKNVKEVADFLSSQTGIKAARPLSVADSAELLEPWLGKSDALKSLPVPRLIALELDRSAPPDLEAVRKTLTEKFSNASLDDHRQWQQQIRTVTRSFALGGFALLLLMAAATTAIIVSATKSSMASNREIVEVLHFVGATDRFIAHEFEKHFLRLGIRAGLIGAVLALLVFIFMPTAMQLLGGGAVTALELQRLVGSGALDTPGYILLGIVVVIVAALCMVTSRWGVYRILNSKR
jgi:cell division transport system permease protein